MAVKATVKVTQSGDLEAFNEGIGLLKDAKVYVGIPEKGTSRRRDQIGPQQKEYVTNAGLLYIHTNGSQLHRIPPRPVIEPAIDANRLRIESILFLAAQAATDGKKAEAKKQINLAGQFTSNACKSWFKDPRNGWAQNRPDTIRRKLGKRPKSRKALKEWLKARRIVNIYSAVYRGYAQYGQLPALDAVNTPLIDTDQLRRAITWVPVK